MNAIDTILNDILRRDLVEVTTKPGTRDCVILTGTLHDPYTGTTISTSTSAFAVIGAAC